MISTDDREVAHWAAAHSLECLPRPGDLAGDSATIADVAAAVTEQLEWDGTVLVLQPTSPLRSGESIRKAVKRFQETRAGSLMSVARERHLYWHDETEELLSPRPLFKQRVNRQYGRHGVLRETGAIQVIRSDELLRRRLMVAEPHVLFELPSSEALDIDTFEDLEVARRRLDSGTVVFRLRANSRVGIRSSVPPPQPRRGIAGPPNSLSLS